jgi:predicted DNA-binding protein
MVTQQSQIKLNLPIELKEFLESKASRFGMPLASYVKHLILKDVEDMEYPTFEASDRTIEKAKEALKNKDKSILVEDIDEFFRELNK